MPVPRDDLRRHGLGHQPELVGDIGFDRRVDIGEGADGAGDGTGGDLAAGVDQALAGAGELRIGLGELDAEGRRLGMDAMRAPDRDRIFVLLGAALQRRKQRVDVGEQDVAGARQLHRERRVEHVGTGHALVHEARLGADDFAGTGAEGDDAVLGGRLDLEPDAEFRLGRPDGHHLGTGVARDHG